MIIKVQGSAWSVRANGRPNVSELSVTKSESGAVTITAMTEKNGVSFCSITLDVASVAALVEVLR